MNRLVICGTVKVKVKTQYNLPTLSRIPSLNWSTVFIVETKSFVNNSPQLPSVDKTITRIDCSCTAEPAREKREKRGKRRERMQLVLLCVLVISLLQPGLLQNESIVETPTNGQSTVQGQHAWLVCVLWEREFYLLFYCVVALVQGDVTLFMPVGTRMAKSRLPCVNCKTRI